MQRLKPRQPRHDAQIVARVRLDEGWTEMAVRNVSKNGLMLTARRLPERGTFIEIKHGEVSLVGQVRWSRDGACGVQVRETLDLRTLSDGRLKPEAQTPTAASVVQVRTADPAQVAERSRLFARVADEALIAVLGIGLSLLLGAAVLTSLKSPFDQLSSSLSASEPMDAGD